MKKRTLLCSLAAFLVVPKESSAGEKSTVGLASWYGQKWHGRKTASGEKFNKNSLTCAYNKGNFGDKLNIIELESGKSVVVTVNDRIGHPGRIVDLSEAAAKSLNIIKKGLSLVRINKVLWLP